MLNDPQLKKFQISSTKSQINLKLQYQMTKTLECLASNIASGFGFLNFGHWDLFVICDL